MTAIYGETIASYKVESISISPPIEKRDNLDFKIVLAHPIAELSVISFVTVTKNNLLIPRSISMNGISISDAVRRRLRRLCNKIVNSIMNGVDCVALIED